MEHRRKSDGREGWGVEPFMEWPEIEQQVAGNYAQQADVRRVEFLGAAGGFSGALFWRLHTGDSRWCLRAWAPEHPTPERLAWIHDVLQHVSSNGCAVVPVPVPTICGPRFVSWRGRLWELAAWLPGEADYHQHPERSKLRAAAATLARFHAAASSMPACPVTIGPARGLQSRTQFMHELAGGLLSQLRRAVSRAGDRGAATATRIFAVYEQCQAAVARDLSDALPLPVRNHACLRDVWHDHILFQDGRVSGLVDFGAMNVDCAAADLSRMLGSLVRDDELAWREGLAAYEAVRPLTANERRLTRVYDATSVLLSGFNWLRWLYLDRRQFESPDQVQCRLEDIADRLAALARTRRDKGSKFDTE